LFPPFLEGRANFLGKYLIEKIQPAHPEVFVEVEWARACPRGCGKRLAFAHPAGAPLNIFITLKNRPDKENFSLRPRLGRGGA